MNIRLVEFGSSHFLNAFRPSAAPDRQIDAELMAFRHKNWKNAHWIIRKRHRAKIESISHQVVNITAAVYRFC